MFSLVHDVHTHLLDLKCLFVLEHFVVLEVVTNHTFHWKSVRASFQSVYQKGELPDMGRETSRFSKGFYKVLILL